MEKSGVSPNNPQVILKFLEKCNSQPSAPGLQWTQENWHSPQTVVAFMQALRAEAKLHSAKGKSVICTISRAALVAALEQKEQQTQAEM